MNQPFLIEDIDTDKCTHIVYGFATLNQTTLLMDMYDPWMDDGHYRMHFLIIIVIQLRLRKMMDQVMIYILLSVYLCVHL